MKRGFQIRTFKTKEDFEQIRSNAHDCNDWRIISEIVCKAAEAETT